MGTRTVTVVYHQDETNWYATSDDVEGFVAAGQDLHETRKLAREGLTFHFEDEPVELDIREQLDSGAPVIEQTAPVQATSAYAAPLLHVATMPSSDTSSFPDLVHTEVFPPAAHVVADAVGEALPRVARSAIVA